jgi:hypothetical protein
MPPLVLTIIGVVQAAIKFAPQAAELFKKAKETFQMLFTSGLITTAQQNDLMAWWDKVEKAVESGETPPQFQVEDDPE